MNKWIPDGICVEETGFPRIVCDEDGNDRKITFLNPKGYSVIKVKVDGCYIKDQRQNKCDWLVIANHVEHFVELKGANLPQADIQLTATIERLSLDAKNREKYAFVIVTRVPKQGVRVQDLQAKYRKRYNARLVVQKTKLEFPFR